MDQEAINVAGNALPDEHLQSAPAGEGSQAPAQETPDTAAQTADPATAQNAQAGEKEPQNPDAQPQETPKKGGIQKRIDELTRERYEAQRQAEFWRQQAEARQQAAQEAAQKPAPRLEDFPDVNQFLEARDAWVMEQAETRILGRLTQEQQRAQYEQQQQAQQIAQQQVVEKFTAQEYEARNRYTDYDAAVASPLMQQVRQVRPDIIQALVDSEHGPDVAYFLAKNPARVQQIASLPHLAAIREIGRLEQMFMGSKQSTTTQAPPPPRTVGGEAKVSPDPNNMSMDEYRKWRSQQR